MKTYRLILGGLGSAIVGVCGFYLIRGQLPVTPLKDAADPAVVQSRPVPLDSASVRLPECLGLFDGTLLGTSGIRAVANMTSADAPAGTFEVLNSDLGQEPSRLPSFALLKDGQVVELKIGATHKAEGCIEGMVRALTSKQDGASLAVGADLLLTGQAASAAHVRWYPSQDASSGEDPHALLQSCKGLPMEAIQSKSLSIYQAHAPLSGKLVHFEWAPVTASAECDGYGNLFAYLGAGGGCQVLQMSPYKCMLSDDLSVMTDAVGLIEFSQGAAQEVLLIVGVSGYESRELVSLPVSKDGKVGTSSCGALFAGGC